MGDVTVALSIFFTVSGLGPYNLNCTMFDVKQR
uniref:Uncharacterized protein n=1 Tax=Anguilla anguilla TaxID=7936 RepID=A0A0E9V954_ANGAN